MLWIWYEKISPLGKTMSLDDDVSILNPPEPQSDSRNEVYEKVVDIMKVLAQIVADKNAPTPNSEAFNTLYQIFIFLSHVVFEDYGTVDNVVNENQCCQPPESLGPKRENSPNEIALGLRKLLILIGKENSQALFG